MTPTAFEEQPPHISSDGLAGPTNNLSFRLRPASQLVEDTSFEKPDVLRPPGTSPAGWVTPDGANRPESGPGTEHAHPLPKVGSFLAETTGDNEAGESMVLPFVDPENQVQHTAIPAMSEVSVVGSQEESDIELGPIVAVLLCDEIHKFCMFGLGFMLHYPLSHSGGTLEASK
eukprot:1160642-Pelagomonas_calceolata.AAC.2